MSGFYCCQVAIVTMNYSSKKLISRQPPRSSTLSLPLSGLALKLKFFMAQVDRVPPAACKRKRSKCLAPDMTTLEDSLFDILLHVKGVPHGLKTYNMGYKEFIPRVYSWNLHEHLIIQRDVHIRSSIAMSLTAAMRWILPVGKMQKLMKPVLRQHQPGSYPPP